MTQKEREAILILGAVFHGLFTDYGNISSCSEHIPKMKSRRRWEVTKHLYIRRLTTVAYRKAKQDAAAQKKRERKEKWKL